MTTYSILSRIDDPVPVAVPDRFSWLAFLLPPIYALVHGLWLEFLGYVVLVVLMGFVGHVCGSAAAFWIYVVLALLIGFEAPSIRRLALARRGFRHRTDLVASNGDIAQVQYLRSEGRS